METSLINLRYAADLTRVNNIDTISRLDNEWLIDAVLCRAKLDYGKSAISSGLQIPWTDNLFLCSHNPPLAFFTWYHPPFNYGNSKRNYFFF